MPLFACHPALRRALQACRTLSHDQTMRHNMLSQASAIASISSRHQLPYFLFEADAGPVIQSKTRQTLVQRAASTFARPTACAISCFDSDFNFVQLFHPKCLPLQPQPTMDLASPLLSGRQPKASAPMRKDVPPSHHFEQSSKAALQSPCVVSESACAALAKPRGRLPAMRSSAGCRATTPRACKLRVSVVALVLGLVRRAGRV
jgi:hypothetical protein